MNKIKQSITLILLICCFSNLSGQETLTLEQCRAMALENNKEIAIAAQNKEMAMTSVKSYRANFLPRISAMGLGYYATGQNDVKIKIDDIQLYDPSSISGYIPPFLSFLTPYIDQFSSVSVPDMDFNLKLNNTYMAGVFVEQPVFMGGKITTAYKMSKIGNELSTLSQQLTEAEVIVQTDDAYWLYVKATELHKSATKYKEVLDEFYRMIENAWKGGMKSQNDALKVQVKLNEAELQVLQASNGVRLARMNLCHIIGIPLSSDVPLPETFDEALSGINREAGITTRPEYAMLNKQIEFKDRQVKLVRSDFLPNIGVSGGYSYAYG
ncbi:TolC family protein, partial [Bacteroidales bacterium OttesenSCG-928-C03]|nr:TolC family protein [Bacteroidales bacterium OttesenSCG-928-C03]